MIYKTNTIVEILVGRYKGEYGIVKRSISDVYVEVNPIVDNKTEDINLIFHVNEVLKRGR